MAQSTEGSHRASLGEPGTNPWREQDACGVGFVARASGEPSHEILTLALQALARVAHRGAASTDNSGDGAGLLTQIPQRFFVDQAVKLGIDLKPGQPFAIGAFFLPREPAALDRVTAIIETVLHEAGLPVLGWREVPVDPAGLGATARATCPTLRHAFVGAPATGWADESAWERALYLARRTIERRVAEGGAELTPFFVCSLSCRTIVYKALLTGPQLPKFFLDFAAPSFQTAIALFHQRYSTNTLPSWPLAQPFRLLAHNGEINTLWGNRNAMKAREPALASPVWEDSISGLAPVIWAEGSDSASLDNALELLVRSGRDPVHSIMMLVPEAHEGGSEMEPSLRGFYEFHECLLEPWDGPAALAFTDGVIAGSALDRNGLRPCRYKITRDGLVVAGSEVGVVDLPLADVVESGSLGPGELLVVDTGRKTILHNGEAKREVAQRRPYASWAARGIRLLRPTGQAPASGLDRAALTARQRAFGYSHEDLRFVLEPMGSAGLDAVWSMGDDTPIPPLSRIAPTLYGYFRQRFAQVTNPPIDALREDLVMSLRMHLGRRGSLLVDRAAGLKLVRTDHPVLLEEEMAALQTVAGVPVTTLPTVWDPSMGTDALRTALDQLSRGASRAVRQGARVLILSDRSSNHEHLAIPMLLAVGAVHQHLLQEGLRTRVGLVAEAGDAWDVHHCAALIGYGAEAVHPWLALESIQALFSAEERRKPSDAPRPTPREARTKFRSAAEKGLLKILSKMGISTLSSYCGAQIFEALGLGAEVIDRCFTGTVSLLGGIGFAEIAEDIIARHRAAYPGTAEVSLPDNGRVRFRKEGEDHSWSPQLVKTLQRAVGDGNAAGGNYGDFTTKLDARGATTIRDLITLRTSDPVPLDEVEPASAIRTRFISTAMSLGALSPEAHRTLAIGMNRMGARSNCGEGGEDPDTYEPLPNGDRADNKIKQVASGRFGVTTQYLMRAQELEIKMAQGSKPGEGGQLPGHKVTALIARLRHSVPGVPLISPPPHHDIYSIEDLAQLIHDLKQVNPRARIGVKLVTEAGVGTVAAGVAKAYADYVLISGHNGGTGASPLSSIKHAGSPWELGLAETQKMLVENGLRHRIEVRTDGGFRTGRDVVIAALLGAEGFGFGTAALVAIGCDMARQCHLNSCPTGIATQRADLRAKFTGTPEQVVAYFTWIAEDVRQILASMGFRSLDEIIGRVDLLERVDRPEVPRAQMLDLSYVLSDPLAGVPTLDDPLGGREAPRRRTVERNDRPGVESLDDLILAQLRPSLEDGKPFAGSYAIGNHHLTVGARTAGQVVERFGSAGLPTGRVHLRFRGSAGQSFGAFTVPGMHLELEGEANDYVGKGLSGGEITIRPFREAAHAGATHRNVILGNTTLYGATSGRLFAAGRAGDRFAVRNSGAVAVIEGAGNHCCEYMTSGVVVVLGQVGRNFGAGMSNGVAFVLDEAGTFGSRCNFDMVSTRPLDDSDSELLQGLIREHLTKTASPRAADVLENWARYRPLFHRVVPHATPAPLTAEPPPEEQTTVAQP